MTALTELERIAEAIRASQRGEPRHPAYRVAEFKRPISTEHQLPLPCYDHGSRPRQPGGLMKTSSWRLYQGPGRVSISRYAPRNTPAGFRVYSKLAPGIWFNKVGASEFCSLYGAQLAALNPQATFDEIVAIAAPAEPVLMCWEVPPFVVPTNWCHRHLVADWLKATIGVDVAELDIPPSAAVKLGRGMTRTVSKPAPDHVVPLPGVEPDVPVVPQSWLDERRKKEE